VARPSKLNAQTTERILTAVRAGCTFEVAAQSAGVGATTFYTWKARGQREERGPYRELWEALKRAEAESELTLLAIVRKAAQTQWQAAMTILERRFPERWGRRDRLNVELRQEYEHVAGALDLNVERLLAIAEGIARGTERED